ncbi:hypothetical protein BPXVP50C5_00038 [Buffalopox virus]|nr:hypothetical protein BPXVP50C5_00038 [Buffalopox virus]UXP71341.1 hypothetical protein [Buffalopox virus]UXP71544.1 hypothetical protein [Buffalopox virus]
MAVFPEPDGPLNMIDFTIPDIYVSQKSRLCSLFCIYVNVYYIYNT